MVCSALIEDEKQQQRAAPTNIRGQDGSGLADPQSSFRLGVKAPHTRRYWIGWENEIPRTSENSSGSPWPHHNACHKYLLGEEQSFSSCFLMHPLQITAVVRKVHPSWCIPAQQYKSHGSFCSPSPKIA